MNRKWAKTNSRGKKREKVVIRISHNWIINPLLIKSWQDLFNGGMVNAGMFLFSKYCEKEMYLLRNISFFSVTSSQTREHTAQTGGRAADVSNRTSHGDPATLHLDYEWADEVCFSFLYWTQTTSGKQNFQCSFRTSISFWTTLKSMFTWQTAKSRLKGLDLS